MKHQLFLFCLFSITFTLADFVNKPIIGIVALPSEFEPLYPSTSYSYFYASFVKFLESGGAQVVPIQYDLPTENMTSLLGSINGVLFTGGGTPLVNPDGTYTRIGSALAYIVNYVVDQNKNGTYYPLWGTCLGFQAIAGILNKNFSILTDDCVGCDGLSKNNVFNTAYQSRLYAQLADDLRDKMTYANLSAFMHGSMFHVDTFANAVPLNSYLTATTFSYDEVGVEYVSSYESPSMPIYGTQFHQEIPTFQWGDGPRINHSLDSVRLQQYLSKFFVNETKKNNNTFPEQQQHLIDNYNTVSFASENYNPVYLFPAIPSGEELSPEEQMIMDLIS